jgi:hypothetical protein
MSESRQATLDRSRSRTFSSTEAVAAEEEGEYPKLVEQERDHRAEIVAGSEPTDQPLARRPGFGEGQARDFTRSAMEEMEGMREVQAGQPDGVLDRHRLWTA